MSRQNIIAYIMNNLKLKRKIYFILYFSNGKGELKKIRNIGSSESVIQCPLDILFAI